MQYHVHPVVFANECDGMEDERMKMGKGWKPGAEVPLRLGRGLEGVSHIWTWGKGGGRGLPIITIYMYSCYVYE